MSKKALSVMIHGEAHVFLPAAAKYLGVTRKKLDSVIESKGIEVANARVNGSLCVALKDLDRYLDAQARSNAPVSTTKAPKVSRSVKLPKKRPGIAHLLKSDGTKQINLDWRKKG